MADGITRTFTILNKKGLHARASAKFVQTVEAFDAVVSVSKDGTEVGGTSIMGLMMLAASQETMIQVCVSGRQMDAAMDAIATLISDRFGEKD